MALQNILYSQNEDVYIKPEGNNTKTRSNDDLKDHIQTDLKDISKQVKIKSIGQRKNKGIVIEAKKYVDLIKQSNLTAQKLVIEKPSNNCARCRKRLQSKKILDCLVAKMLVYLEEIEAEIPEQRHQIRNKI